MKKGISPIVAVVLLIAIAVIAAVGLYFWVGSYMQPGDTPPPPAMMTAQCTNAGESTNGTVIVSNIGPGSITKNTLRVVIGTTETAIADGGSLAESGTMSINASAAGAALTQGVSGTIFSTEGSTTTFTCRST